MFDWSLRHFGLGLFISWKRREAYLLLIFLCIKFDWKP